MDYVSNEWSTSTHQPRVPLAFLQHLWTRRAQLQALIFERRLRSNRERPLGAKRCLQQWQVLLIHGIIHWHLAARSGVSAATAAGCETFRR